MKKSGEMSFKLEGMHITFTKALSISFLEMGGQLGLDI